MKLVNTYLTDEELEQLICEVEENELVAAPPDMLERILANVEAQECSDVEKNVSGMQEDQNRQRMQEKKIKEFRAYCFRVVTSVAAAILLIFVIPDLMDTQIWDMFTSQDEMAWTEYQTQEEIWNDTGILQKTLGGNHIFNQNSELNIFKQ